jgi:hypothetical protein
MASIVDGQIYQAVSFGRVLAQISDIFFARKRHFSPFWRSGRRLRRFWTRFFTLKHLGPVLMDESQTPIFN